MARRVVTAAANLTDGATPWVDASDCPWWTVYAVGNGGTIGAGVVTLQTGSFMTGVQSEIDAAPGITVSVTLTVTGATVGGVVYAQFPVGAWDKIRVKVTTPITGGGVPAFIFVGNGST